MDTQTQIGFGGDLMVASEKFFSLTGGYSWDGQRTLITICDLFLLNDKVIFRADPETIFELSSAFSDEDLNELTKTQRIGFYLPKYHNTGFNKGETLEKKIFERFKYSKHFIKQNTNIQKTISLVFDNILQEKTQQTFEEFELQMTKLFFESFEKDERISMDVQIGFKQSLAKIRELWAIGINSIYYDWEIHNYLDRCDKAAYLKNVDLNIKPINPSHSIIDDLHYFKNIPSIAEIIHKSDEPTELFIDIVNSHEASDFRNWLKSNAEKNVDIRDMYMRSQSKLPAKDKWIDWLRFGSVSVISTILGTIASSNPAIGFLVGTGVGVVDKVYGDKFLNSASTVYSPDNWVNFIQRKS